MTEARAAGTGPAPGDRPGTDVADGAAPGSAAASAAPTPDRAHSGVGYSPLSRPGTASRIGRGLQRGQERAAVLAFRSASRALSALPAGVADAGARTVFRAGYLLWPAKRRIIHANAAHILGRPADDPAVGRLARAIYTSYARFALELMRLPHAPQDEPLRLMPPSGDAHARFLAAWTEASAAGHGVIAASAHIGSIDVFAGSYALAGYPTWGLADDTAYPELFDLLNRQRRRWGVGVIPWRNLREIFRIMRAPCVLGMLVDWGYRPDDIPVRLFGAWTTLPAGPATLAARTGALILPVISLRQRDGSYRSVARDVIRVADGSPAEIRRATQAIADVLGELIRPDPRQWFAFKPIWPATAEEARRLEERARAMDGA
ncbi:MAG: lysophospholipid acyltransferase family protein [Chloroflexota bacterium]